jgi:hypothetical protein
MSQINTGLHVQCPLFLSDFNFLDTFFENKQISNLTKIRSVRAEFLLADRRTDRETNMAKLVVDFRNFANAPKNALLLTIPFF